MSSDRFTTSVNTGKVTVRSGGHDTTAVGTAITLHQQGTRETIKETMAIAMTPNTQTLAAQTLIGTKPGVIAFLSENLLEINRDKPYHDNSFFRAPVLDARKGGEFAKTLRPLLF